MEINKENVLNFNESDWRLERQSGYFGYRNINKHSPLFDEWIYDSEFKKLKYTKSEYESDYKLLSDFNRDMLGCDAIGGDDIDIFLDNRYFH